MLVRPGLESWENSYLLDWFLTLIKSHPRFTVGFICNLPRNFVATQVASKLYLAIIQETFLLQEALLHELESGSNFRNDVRCRSTSLLQFVSRCLKIFQFFSEANRNSLFENSSQSLFNVKTIVREVTRNVGVAQCSILDHEINRCETCCMQT